MKSNISVCNRPPFALFMSFCLLLVVTVHNQIIARRLLGIDMFKCVLQSAAVGPETHKLHVRLRSGEHLAARDANGEFLEFFEIFFHIAVVYKRIGNSR